MKRGRNKDTVWDAFEKINGSNTTMECKKCELHVSARVERLKAHFTKCSTAPRSYENVVPATSAPSRAHADAAETVPPTASDAHVTAADHDVELVTAPKKARQQRLDRNFVVKTTQTTKDRLDKSVASMFYACNIPFNAVENPHLRKAIGELRPGYQPPTRKALAGHLLDSTYDEITARCYENIKGENVVLQQDGWSDVHNSPVIATIVSTTKSIDVIEVADIGPERKTAEFCAAKAKEGIQKIEEKIGCKVIGVVTDNEPKMVKMRQILQEDIPGLFTYGCASHYLNLLGQKLTKESVVARVVTVAKYFRNHHVPSAVLKEAGATKLQLPGATRWNSTVDTLEAYVKNRPLLLMACAQHEADFDTAVVKIVQDTTHFQKCTTLLQTLKPVAVSLDRLQANSATVADACEEWINLSENLDLEAHLELIRESSDRALTGLHFAANTLDPRYRGERLASAQNEAAQDFVRQMITDDETFDAFLEWRIKLTPVPPSLSSVCTKVNPLTWWKSLRLSTSNPALQNLCDFAVKVVSLVASSAGIERVFSTLGAVQTTVRNRLGVQKATKLAVCYMNLRDRDNDPTSW
jgi:hypothetical protein